MSLVGTRPILPDELEQYELHHRARIAIKPGITGMWQVSGRSDITDFEEIVRLDTEYISEWNIKNKIKIHLVTQCMILLEIIIFISTAINSGSMRNAVDNAILIVYAAIFINYCAEKNRIFLLIKSMMLHLELCTYINLVTVIMKPDGFFTRTISAYGKTQEWFLGSDHYFVVWAIPAFLIAILYCELTGDKKRSYFLICATIVTQFIRVQ